jgi:3-phosphoshikimate 1-carboxyvinyltransferase
VLWRGYSLFPLSMLTGCQNRSSFNPAITVLDKSLRCSNLLSKMTAFKSYPIRDPLLGTIAVSGDKSISHRALIFGAMSVGETTITNLLEGDDVLRTAAAVRALGAEVDRRSDGTWSVHGCGVGGFHESAEVLDLGNSGTGVRLLMGLAATLPFTTFFAGDSSLSRRPMGRVMTPLEKFGTTFVSRAGLLPCVVHGAKNPPPVEHQMTVASAQVKSAILLAGLNAPGETAVVETVPTRDHTERMLRAFGAEVSTEETGAARRITVVGQPELIGRAVHVPVDPSSAAFFVVAATLIEGSDVTIERVSINPLRAGLFEVLQEMGANITLTNTSDLNGEPVADLRVRAAPLHGIDVSPTRAPSMIDEYPVLAIAAAHARGDTVMRGLEELRVKESNRLSAIVWGLIACGVSVEATDDSLVVHGCGGDVPGGGQVTTHHDHRIAMAFAVLGFAARRPVTIDDDQMIATSFPTFTALAEGLGGRLVPLSK